MIMVSLFPAKEQGVLSSTVRRLPGESRELNVRYLSCTIMYEWVVTILIDMMSVYYNKGGETGWRYTSSILG